MNRARIALMVILITAFSVQLFPPVLNKSRQVLVTDFSRIFPVPSKVQAILKESCYDCHSNHTNYPWYVRLQPVGWWMNSHIEKGKAALNFSDFGGYSIRRQQNKLKAIANSIQDQTMPLISYTLIHRGAKLTALEKAEVNNWIEKITDSLSKKN